MPQPKSVLFLVCNYCPNLITTIYLDLYSGDILCQYLAFSDSIGRLTCTFCTDSVEPLEDVIADLLRPGLACISSDEVDGSPVAAVRHDLTILIENRNQTRQSGFFRSAV